MALRRNNKTSLTISKENATVDKQMYLPSKFRIHSQRTLFNLSLKLKQFRDYAINHKSTIYSSIIYIL